MQTARKTLARGSLFDAFFVVGIEVISGAANSFTSSVKLTFSEIPVSQRILQEYAEECFPETSVDNVKQNTTLSYTIVTVNSEAQYFLFCKRIIPKANSKENAICLCFLTKYPFQAMFSNALEIVEALYSNNQPNFCTIPSQLNSGTIGFLKSFFKVPFPMPGECFHVSVPEQSDYRLVRPDEDDCPLSDVNYSHLFASLSLNQIFGLLTSVLLERKIVFTSTNINKLYQACYASAAMIYPFNWKDTLIPVLPKSMLNIGFDKNSYIIGVQAHLMPVFNQISDGNVHVVDLDAKPIEEGDTGLSNILPQPSLVNLRTGLQKVTSKWNRSSPIDDSAISAAFLSFFASIFGNYKKFIRDDQSRVTFNHEQFISNSNITSKQFLERFKETKMYVRFIDERESIVQAAKDGIIPTGAFERLIYSSGQSSTGYLSSLKSDVSEKFTSFRGIVKGIQFAKAPQAYSPTTDGRKASVVQEKLLDRANEKQSQPQDKVYQRSASEKSIDLASLSKTQENPLTSPNDNRRMSKMMLYIPEMSVLRAIPGMGTPSQSNQMKVPFESPFHLLHQKFAPRNAPVETAPTPLLAIDESDNSASNSYAMRPALSQTIASTTIDDLIFGDEQVVTSQLSQTTGAAASSTSADMWDFIEMPRTPQYSPNVAHTMNSPFDMLTDLSDASTSSAQPAASSNSKLETTSTENLIDL